MLNLGAAAATKTLCCIHRNFSASFRSFVTTVSAVQCVCDDLIKHFCWKTKKIGRWYFTKIYKKRKIYCGERSFQKERFFSEKLKLAEKGAATLTLMTLSLTTLGIKDTRHNYTQHSNTSNNDTQQNIMLSDTFLIVMLCVIVLSVVLLNVITLKVVAPKKVGPTKSWVSK